MANDRKRWLVDAGQRPKLAAIDTRSRDGAPGSKAETTEALVDLATDLADRQGRLWAEGQRSLLVVLQAMDAAGKDGTVKHVFSGMNPMGIRATAFKAPGPEELAHDFLWRVHAVTPRKGEVGIFNRSHYEDVLIARVDDLVPETVWRERYEAIRNFERMLTDAGTTIVKIYLHISKEEQADRFRQRLEDPAKRWKFAKADIDVRARWDDYREAYEDAIEETSTADAPWYVVPADRKWYRNWAVSRILIETLTEMKPEFPPEEPGLDQLVIE
ncbi:MAG TPA: polyphosphate kinase 2 family protein [Acidimicrobiales bacterium]